MMIIQYACTAAVNRHTTSEEHVYLRCLEPVVLFRMNEHNHIIIIIEQHQHGS